MTENINSKGESHHWTAVRALFIAHENLSFIVLPTEKLPPTPIRVTLSVFGSECPIFAESIALLSPQMAVNLVRLQQKGGRYEAEMIVLLPDFLIDISSIAACFKPYGASVSDFILSKLSSNSNTQHTLLGHFANLFLDECLDLPNREELTYEEIMSTAFKQYAFALSTCPDLTHREKEKLFFENCRTQFTNLKGLIGETFAIEEIDSKNLIIEPSFICPALGIQGRLDVMSADYRAFIELKSGKGEENAYDVRHREPHFVQMMLYYAVMQFNLAMSHEHIRAFLLYSRYPKLMYEHGFWGIVKEAINLRNQIAASEFTLQRENNPEITRHAFVSICPDTLNTKKISGMFWEKYLAPEITRFHKNWTSLSVTEQYYVATLYNFVLKEHFLSKTGSSNEHRPCAASVWQMSDTEKMEGGEMIASLRLLTVQTMGNKQHLIFELPQHSEITNFRPGDLIIAYTKDEPCNTATNRHLFKGAIINIHSERVELIVRNCQQNTNVYPIDSLYAIERDYPDTAFSLMFRGIGAFIEATISRKELLLGLRRPRHNKVVATAGKMEYIVEKALAAEDYFLLMGPPGTGKTSQALRQMVERVLLLDSDKNILLIAYTNKAVDEMCHALCNISSQPSFIRLGQTESCETQFHSSLLENKLAPCRNRNQVRQEIARHRIFVGTLTTLCSKLDLFHLKHFDIAIVDEASQILEPQFLPLWCAQHAQGGNAIDRFIFIGDHKQLPAIVLQTPKESTITVPELTDLGIENASMSLFERLYRRESALHGNQSPVAETLIYQGRMHPEISDFVSANFYNNQLHPIPLPHQREVLANRYNTLDEWILSKRIAFINTPTNDEQIKCNTHEAKTIASIVKMITTEQQENGGNSNPAAQFGIIAPYRSQIATIRTELRNNNIQHWEEITVDTVERFQGGQRDIILFSCCINRKSQFDQLCSNIEENGIIIDRKLNVALTRARKQLFIVGNSEILEQNPIYLRLIQYISSRDGILPSHFQKML